MEMKLNTQRIKTLRLGRSWSQEKLAEECGLNPRTIQRVETDGSASLHTRLRIARAFGVEPGELDIVEVVEAGVDMPSPIPVATAVPSGKSYYVVPFRFVLHLPVLLLIALVYLTSTPIFFSLSRSNFQPLGPDAWSGQYMLVILVFWSCVALPWMGAIYVRHRVHLRLHMMYLGALVLFSVLRVLQQELARSLLSIAIYLSGLVLLYTCFRASVHRALARHLVFVTLAAYLFVLLVHNPLSGFFVVNYFRWEQGLDIMPPWISFLTFVGRQLSQTTQLIPLVLVLLFDLGRPRSSSPPISGYGDESHGLGAAPG
jgi:transcriptional regulator with XRE-family HTH domain